MSGNIRQLKVIAVGLGDLRNDVVFVGGSVAELYADDPAATDIRPTMDVDCVISSPHTEVFIILSSCYATANL